MFHEANEQMQLLKNSFVELNKTQNITLLFNKDLKYSN